MIIDRCDQSAFSIECDWAEFGFCRHLPASELNAIVPSASAPPSFLTLSHRLALNGFCAAWGRNASTIKSPE
jgi:hypothetical protein